MSRFLLLAFFFIAALPARRAAAQADATGLPPRPAPFRFVNDQAQLMAPADAKKLESGLRRYADNTGTQVVVVTVPSLGGRTVAGYGRALGTAWGVGQRNKNNGIIVLLSAKEHQVTIQPGSGLKSAITPVVISRAINEMTPGFKQGNYFGGLRTGLNTLMLSANPDSNPKKNQLAATTGTGSAASVGAAGTTPAKVIEQASASATTTNDPIMAPPAPAPAPVSSGLGIGALLIGALVIGGGLWFLLRLFRRGGTAGAAAPAGPTTNTPDFLPNRPIGPAGYGPGQAPGNYGPGYGSAPNQSGGGMGMGGILATGAAVAAGAYLGNRLASGHDTSGQNLANDGTNANPGTGAGAAGAGAAGAGTAAAGDYFSSREGGTTGADNAAPDYFSDDNKAADNSSSDYFSSDDNNSSYDDTSSNDTGGGGFDGDGSGSDNSGSW